MGNDLLVALKKTLGNSSTIHRRLSDRTKKPDIGTIEIGIPIAKAKEIVDGFYSNLGYDLYHFGKLTYAINGKDGFIIDTTRNGNSTLVDISRDQLFNFSL